MSTDLISIWFFIRFAIQFQLSYSLPSPLLCPSSHSIQTASIVIQIKVSYKFRNKCKVRGLRILANSQLEALFHVFIYFTSLHVSSITVLIIRRSNCINTSSGMISMISLCKWLLDMPIRREPPDRHTKQSLTQTNHTRWCINTIRSPDDEHCDARNM